MRRRDFLKRVFGVLAAAYMPWALRDAAPKAVGPTFRGRPIHFNSTLGGGCFKLELPHGELVEKLQALCSEIRRNPSKFANGKPMFTGFTKDPSNGMD